MTIQKTTVEVLTCTANDILANRLQNDEGEMLGELSIPEYQRPYCWKEQQIEQLLTDITMHQHNEKSQNLPYYLGSLILHQENGKLNIIDGQQRITTLMLLSCFSNVQDRTLANCLKYKHPSSQERIKSVFKWLKSLDNEKQKEKLNTLDFEKLQFTLIITQTEDDAYRFFETQNTGGVRLTGIDIIKAYHLRAINHKHQKNFAKQWESLGQLDDTVNALLKGRCWQQINFRKLPSYKERIQLRDLIEFEFAKQTDEKDEDIAFGGIYRKITLTGEINLYFTQQGYALRQPLNAGVNTIRYLSYFQNLYKRYFEQINDQDLWHLSDYVEFINWLKKLEGCYYLEALYKACLLQYISQFGEYKLDQAAKKLFRVVYSLRVSNKKSVRENSIAKFIKETPVLDWIAQSYTAEQCFNYLDRFKLTVDHENLDRNSVKKRFIAQVAQVNEKFELNLDLSSENSSQDLTKALTNKIGGDAS